MSRIFFSLSLFALLLMVANLAVGLWGGDFNAAAARLSTAERTLRMRRGAAPPEELQELEQQYSAARRSFEPHREHATLHMLLGLAAALVTILVNSITVTYFIGTGRWCREVCDTYQLEPRLLDKSARLKRTAFPWSVAGIVATITIVSFGAASDPSALGAARAQQWVSFHWLAAVLGIGVIAYAFYRQVIAVGANYEVIEEILREVNAIRAAKGLDRLPAQASDSSAS